MGQVETLKKLKRGQTLQGGDIPEETETVIYKTPVMNLSSIVLSDISPIQGIEFFTHKYFQFI